jgi:hypothetical protein
MVVNAAVSVSRHRAAAKPLERQHFTSAADVWADMIAPGSKGPGEGSMFDQTLGGSLRNLAIGLVLTAGVVGAAFALAFY